jgi:polysaccharide pyruvyl transferase WcaK-like protein
MKNCFPVITLFGSNSGNNVGDAAILSAILEVFSKELPTARFLVPTVNPDFINTNYGSRYKVRAMNIMPWNGALRFLGLPSLYCLWKSDVAFICDGIIFGKRLFNPAFNMLITLAPLAFFARLLGCRLCCYSVGIGPFPKGQGAKLARYLIQSCDLIMMREGESRQTAVDIGVTKQIESTGDAAYLNPVSSEVKASEICTQLGIAPDCPLLGINVTRYVDSWLGDASTTSDPATLINTIASGVRAALSDGHVNFRPVVFSTHPMDCDLAKQLAALLDAPLVSNTVYLSHDMQAVMQKCTLFIGMRFHSLVLASAVGVPIIGLVYAPKVRGLMTSMNTPEYALELPGLTPSKLAERIVSAWSNLGALVERQQMAVNGFKDGAHKAARLVCERFFPNSAS